MYITDIASSKVDLCLEGHHSFLFIIETSY